MKLISLADICNKMLKNIKIWIWTENKWIIATDIVAVVHYELFTDRNEPNLSVIRNYQAPERKQVRSVCAASFRLELSKWRLRRIGFLWTLKKTIASNYRKAIAVYKKELIDPLWNLSFRVECSGRKWNDSRRRPINSDAKLPLWDL